MPLAGHPREDPAHAARYPAAMRTRVAPIALALAVTACSEAAPTNPPAPAAPPAPSFSTDGQPFLARHCTHCHGGAEPEAGLALDRVADEAGVLHAFRTWDEVRGHVHDRSMPPEDEPAPTPDERARFLAWLDATLARADRTAPPDPGRVTLRRLNRSEYRRTIVDLLGVDAPEAATFPPDDVGYGFDTIGDVLSLPPLTFERYVDAAEAIALRALPVEDPAHPAVRRVEGADLPAPRHGGTTRRGGRMLATNDELAVEFRAPRAGTYVVRVGAWGQQAGSEPARLRITAGAGAVQEFDVHETQRAPGTFELQAELPAGACRVRAAFVNDYYEPQAADPAQRDRNLAIESIELTGPLDAHPPALPPPVARMLAAGDGAADEDARRTAVLRALADRTFRRPATDGEVARLATLAATVQRGEQAPFERGVQAALVAVLVSPHFLFRAEPHPHPDDPAWVRDLDDVALASRLSYFLWSSMPDDRLLALARAGRLHAELAAEAERLLDDPRADALADDFGSQWLETRRLATATPDPVRFPEFDDALRASMQRESRAFLRAVLRERRSARELLDADWTFVDERLARLYGIPGVHGDELVRVPLAGTQRGGVLGQAAVLTVTSYPTRTSPVKRGKWLLGQILGAPTPPPPPGVGDLDDSAHADTGLPLRTRLERHRTEPTCAVCHARMDPLGFALEPFDAIGRYRTHDDGVPIDASAELPDGRRFDGPAELRRTLLADDAFVRHLTAELLTYALGRAPLPSDDDVVRGIVEGARPGGMRLRDLVLGVATSEPFRRHRGEEVAR